MTTNLDIIRATYEGSSQDNGRQLRAALAPDARWTEAAGFPYAAPPLFGRASFAHRPDGRRKYNRPAQ